MWPRKSEWSRTWQGKRFNEMRIVSWKVGTFYRAGAMNDSVKWIIIIPREVNKEDDQKPDGGTVYNRISTAAKLKI